MTTFRPACPEDAERLAQVRQKAWESAYRGIYPDEMIDEFDYPGHTRRFLRQMENPRLHIYAVEDSGEIIGYVILGYDKNGGFQGIPVCIYSLYLIPAYHRKGIGRNIMDYVKAWCRARGETAFYNSCNPHNRQAMAFYEVMGGRLAETDGGHEDPSEDQCWFVYALS